MIQNLSKLLRKSKIKNMRNKLKEDIEIIEEVFARTESTYLIISNKKRCSELIGRSDLDFNDIIDSLTSLHMVLEVSLNSLFRNLALFTIKIIDSKKVMENIDNIDFISKTVLFIYNSKFDFNTEKEKAIEYHSIIGKIKNFSEIRNKLLHGHSISTMYKGSNKIHSNLKNKINLNFLSDQIRKFKFIMEGMRFYIDCLDSSLTLSGKESLKKEYLNDDFLLNLIVE